MGIKQKIKNLPWLYNTLLFFLNSTNYFNRRFHQAFPKYLVSPYWRARIDKVRQSADNKKINRVTDAGKVFPEYQLMHNGIKITLGSYYDYGNTHLLIENEGVHEPQEEYVFQQILPFIREGGTMMELGSYWAFYSLWFASIVKNAKCFMIEPDPHKMNFGKLNFKLNGRDGQFRLGFIDGFTNTNPGIPVYDVDFLMKSSGIDFLDILHSDIQGYELKMLKGAREALSTKKVGYAFISTHSNELHRQCIDELKSYGYVIIADANLDESFATDGVIVAKRPGAPGPDSIGISKAATTAG
ncbi:MAG TPA: FkbM family methyltransferase [Cyclobacteriaceae bacterium]|nr:FkbM family methyltransferase [Cyclobacteriaceae bacterium]